MDYIYGNLKANYMYAEGKPIGNLGWEANIRFFAPISEKSIKEIEDLAFDIEERKSGIALRGFIIKTPPMSADNAFLYSQEIANRVFDYLSAIHKYHITGYLSNITEIKPAGEMKTGIAHLATDAIIHKDFDLDLREIEPLLKKRDIKLMRQLAHYRMGLESRDLVTKVQQFYQVAEDEYTKDNSFIKEYNFVRHISSHPQLNRKTAKEAAEKYFGKNYIDLSDPKDMEKLQRSLDPIKLEAKKIIDSKLKI